MTGHCGHGSLRTAELQRYQYYRTDTTQIYAQYLSDTSTSWLAVIEHGLPESPERRTIATLCSAVIDGLVLDYMSSGQLDRTSAALHFFVALLERHHQPHPLPTRRE